MKRITGSGELQSGAECKTYPYAATGRWQVADRFKELAWQRRRRFDLPSSGAALSRQQIRKSQEASLYEEAVDGLHARCPCTTLKALGKAILLRVGGRDVVSTHPSECV
jgi:hypothetical protein